MSRAAHDALLRYANEIDNRLGPIPGHFADRIAETMRRASVEHEERVGELLAANNREVERRREAQDALRALLAAVDVADACEGLDNELYEAAKARARAALGAPEIRQKTEAAQRGRDA